MTLDNLERWQFYMKDMSSPASFIDWGFYALIAASLQRRLWVGADEAALYPNIYTVLVADPGIGKGLVIDQITEMLTFHKEELAVDKASQDEAKEINAAIVDTGHFQRNNNRKVQHERETLIPLAPDAVTYEALTDCMAKAIRFISYKKPDGTLGYYSHSSLCFSLEEISSLFRKHTEDTVNFLLRAYNCKDYKYQTKTQGTANIKRCCLNILGGTQPHFIQKLFGDELLTEGFASRTFFIFAYSNRFQRLYIPTFSKEQLAARTAILDHVKKLTTLYGRVELSKEADEFLIHWWEHVHPFCRPNKSLKLDHYYARKNIHVLKMAMVLHFSDKVDFKINLEEVQTALALLDETEKNMHLALSFDNRNPLSAISSKIAKWLEQGQRDWTEILIEFYGQGSEAELRDCLTFLVNTKKINYNTTTKKFSCRPDLFKGPMIGREIVLP